MLSKKDYVLTQVGNPEGEDKPNKKYVKFTLTSILKLILIVPLFRYYDPRVWVREGEKTMSQRVTEGLEDFNTKGQV